MAHLRVRVIGVGKLIGRAQSYVEMYRAAVNEKREEDINYYMNEICSLMDIISLCFSSKVGTDAWKAEWKEMEDIIWNETA